MPSSTTRQSSFLSSFVPTLTTTSHISALVFSSFLVVHLGAPLAAAAKVSTNVLSLPFGSVDQSSLGGFISSGSADAASKWMILGRVYYQNAVSEPVVVWGALVVHLAASALKRGILTYLARQRGLRSQNVQSGPSVIPSTNGQDLDMLPLDAQAAAVTNASTRASSSSSLPSLHTVSAYLLTPLLLVHTYLHRIAPLDSRPPISSLSPSELDYTFVHYGLRVYPWLYWSSIVGLVATASYHVAGGVGIIGQRMVLQARARRARTQQQAGSNSAAKAKPTDKKRKQGPAKPALIGSLLVLLGVWGIYGDAEVPHKLVSSSSWIGKRVSSDLAACECQTRPLTMGPILLASTMPSSSKCGRSAGCDSNCHCIDQNPIGLGAEHACRSDLFVSTRAIWPIDASDSRPLILLIA